jgi:hypothetical protein
MISMVALGNYVPELGGFRHSDTILITAIGTERPTDYPRDLVCLTVPVAWCISTTCPRCTWSAGSVVQLLFRLLPMPRM